MSNYDELQRIEKIEVPKAGSLASYESEEPEGDPLIYYDKPMAYYAIPKDSPLERLFDTILQVLAGQNKTGKIIGKGKDIISYLIPLGREIDAFTDQIGILIKRNIMENPTVKQDAKKPTESRTLILNGLIGVASLLMLVGVIPIDAIGLDPSAPWAVGAHAIMNMILRFITTQPVQVSGK